MDGTTDTQEGLNRSPSNGRMGEEDEKPKLVVTMGPTGSGKSRLAIDLASYFPIEIINADSMQVYQGLDVLTNKVPLNEQKGVPHHLLGTIMPNVEFTAKDFRDSTISLIKDILSRNCIPVIGGGTSYYIQALVSPFLLDDSADDIEESCVHGPPGEDQRDDKLDCGSDTFNYSYEYLKDIDPVAANRIHPHNHRKKRRLNRLQTLFGWNINYVDATESISSRSDDLWATQVVEPAAKIIRCFLNENASSMRDLDAPSIMGQNLIQRDLWTQYT